MMPALHEKTVSELSSLLSSKEVSARELADAFIARTEAVEPTVKAFLTLTPEEATRQASEVDRRRAAGEKLGPLAGIPYALKDNMCTRGIRTTCGSRILPNFVPPYSATVAGNLGAAGAV